MLCVGSILCGFFCRPDTTGVPQQALTMMRPRLTLKLSEGPPTGPRRASRRPSIRRSYRIHRSGLRFMVVLR